MEIKSTRFCFDMKPGYEVLAEVLYDALEQAQSGKGHERHADSEPFNQQEICQGARKCGTGAMVYQVRKKSLEALRLFERHGPDRAVPDLLGAINYAAACIIVMRESTPPATCHSNAKKSGEGYEPNYRD